MIETDEAVRSPDAAPGGPGARRPGGRGRPLLAGVRASDTAHALARGVSSSLGIRVASVGIGFVVQMLLARLLGAASYGDYAYALAWQNVLLVVATVGYDATALRFVAVYHGAQRWSLLRGFLRHSQALVLACGLGVSALAILIVLLLGDRLRTELAVTMMVAFLLVPFTALLQLQSLSLLGLKRIALAQAPRDVLRPLLLGGALVLVAVQARSLISATSAMVINLVTILPALLISGVGLHRLLAPSVREHQPEEQRAEWRHVATFLFVIAALQLLLERVDVLLLGSLMSTREAGIYSVAQRLAGLMAIGLSAVNAIVAPMIASLHASGKQQELQRTVTLAVRGLLAFALPAAALLVIFGRHALALFGAEFTSGYVVLIVLTIGAILNITGGLAGFLLTMTGHQREAARVVGGGVALSIALNAALIPLWGMVGASVATVVALAARNFALQHYIRARLGIRTSPLLAV